MFKKAIIVRSKTRLEQLIERFNTKSQAEFYIERSGGEFSFYQNEHERFYESLERVINQLSIFDSYKVLEKRFLHAYVFAETDLIIVIGQDGLVANTAKYVNGQPIVAINPDPDAYDGVLLPFSVDRFEKSVKKIQSGNLSTKQISMGEAKFSDGQTLLAFNDFFIGQRSHVSARYVLEYNGLTESQSSSGVLVSTGAGSTGWMSSLFNMVNGINHFYGEATDDVAHTIEWGTRKLLFAVREPFISKQSDATITFGELTHDNELKIESQMPENGVVFSDGIEADAISFNTGIKVSIGLAKENANLVS